LFENFTMYVVVYCNSENDSDDWTWYARAHYASFIFLQPISMETIIWSVNKVESYSFEILCWMFLM
jgi:hypothetical protein